MSREQKIAKAMRLRKRGETYAQIAQALGVATCTIHRWVNPDSNERHLRTSREAKRRRQVVTCADCGKKLAYDRQHNERCQSCQHEYDYGEENREIVRLWEEGLSGEQIAERLGNGLTPDNIRSRIQYHRERGVVAVLHRERNRHKWAEIASLYREGLSLREIGERVGLDSYGVGSRVQSMRKAGIDLPRRRKAAA